MLMFLDPVYFHALQLYYPYTNIIITTPLPNVIII